MAEDPTLTEYCLGHLEADRIVVTCEGEMAYALDQVSNGEFATIRSLVRLNTPWGEM